MCCNEQKARHCHVASLFLFKFVLTDNARLILQPTEKAQLKIFCNKEIGDEAPKGAAASPM